MDSGARILEILDSCAERFVFPSLDNGYVYLAATRLTLFRSDSDWALVIETFGFSPRAGIPDVCVYTFASTLPSREGMQFVTADAHRNYLAIHPHDEMRSFGPVEEGPWIDFEHVVESSVVLRGETEALPPADDYARKGIELESRDELLVYEMCRYLASVARERVLATDVERRIMVLPEMNQLMQLEEWHHPDLTSGERPSQVEAFRQLARVLEMGDTSQYHPTEPANTHWKNWPEGGTL